MNEVVKALDAIGEKQWFREQMGMTRGKLSVIFEGILEVLYILTRILHRRNMG